MMPERPAKAWQSEEASRTPPRVVAIWKRDVLPYSETFVANQARYLESWSPRLIGERSVVDGLADPDFAIYPSHLPRWRRAPFRLLRYSRRLRNYLIRESASLIHAQFGYSAVDILPTARRLGLPLVVTFHGVDATGMHRSKKISDWLYVNRIREVFEYATYLIAVSEFIAERLVEAGADRRKVRTIYTGVPQCASEEGVDQGSNKMRRRSEHPTDILFVGRLVEKKGLLDLIAAMAILRDRGLTPNATIVGDGPLHELAESSIQNYKLTNVSLVGRQSVASVDLYMREHSIFCVPSRTAENGDSEGLGMVFLEASARGMAIVSTRHGGIPEAVIDQVSGLLVQEGDVDAIADALTLLVKSTRLRRRLGSAGQEYVKVAHNVDTQTRKLESLYDSATGGIAQIGLRD